MVTLDVDFRELQNFSESLKDIDKRTDVAMRQSLEFAANQFLQDVIARTPVDTGRLKKQWGIDNVNLAARVVDEGWGYSIEVYNSTPYASFAEFTHRQFIWGVWNGKYTLGRFYLTKTDIEYNNGKLDVALSQAFNKWLKHTFK